MDDSTIDLSIVIPSYNTGALTLACIESILTKNWRASIEIIVADNHSTDRTVDLVTSRFPVVKCRLLASNRGYGAACNEGAAISSGNILLFLNNDTRVLDGSLDILVDGFRTFSNLGAAACREVTLDGKTVMGCRGLHSLSSGISFLSGFRLFRREGNRFLIPDWDRNDDRWVDTFSGFAWAIRRETFERIGRFDEHLFMYFEEPDFALRLSQHGLRIRYFSSARIVHHGARANLPNLGHFGVRKQWVKAFIYWRKKYKLSASSWLDWVILYPFLAMWGLGYAVKAKLQPTSSAESVSPYAQMP